MRFLCVGAGAIGTYVGGSLAAAGHDVTFIEQPAMIDALSTTGLHIHKPAGDVGVSSIALVDSPAAALAAGPYDICILALKSFDTAAAVDSLLATGEDVPTVLSLQNGVDNEPTIAERLGSGRVIAGTVASSIAKPGIGEVIEETHRGLGIALGHPLAHDLIAALNDAGLTARGYPEAGPMKWSKLLTNLPGNATSAILDMTVADIFADRRLYAIEVQVLRECLAVMTALRFRPVDLPSTPVRALAFAARHVPRVLAQPILTRGLGSSRGDKMPSFHIDLHSGRGCTEVEYLNGAVVRHGAGHGVPTPVNDVLTQTLLSLSRGDEDLHQYRGNPQAFLQLFS